MVASVEKAVEGSAELLTSDFWAMLKHPPGVREVTTKLNVFLAAHGLERIDSETFGQRFPQLGKIDERSRHCTSLSWSVQALPSSLTRLTLLALVEREADFGGTIEVVELARSFLDEHLERFLWNQSVDIDEGFYERMLSQLLHGGKSVNEGSHYAVAQAESRSSKLIVPR